MAYIDYKHELRLYEAQFDIDLKDKLTKYFDIIYIDDLNKINWKNYNLVLISSMIYVSKDLQSVYEQIKYLKSVNKVVILFHDLHDYSLDVNNSKLYKNTVLPKIKKCIPYLKDSDGKKLYQKLFNQFENSYMISIYDCPEFVFFRQYLNSVKKFYLINHSIPKSVFKPISCKKKYDILYYGRSNTAVYPLRVRILRSMKNIISIRVKIIKYDENITDDKLCKMINESWICITCISNFSYFVRKYLEISSCNSIVCGDINPQGYKIIGTNMIYINRGMPNTKILEKVKYYLNNKDIMAALCFNKLEAVSKENYDCTAEKLNEICQNIQTGTQTRYQYDGPIVGHPKQFTHTKKEIDISSKLDSGLYVYVCNVTDIEIKLADHKIVNKDNYIIDYDMLYIPFRLSTPLTIKFPENSKLFKIDVILE